MKKERMMADMFHASEVIEIALRIEQNGGTFYGLAADKMTNPPIKELFLDLAKEERKHFDVFQKLLSRASHWEPLGVYAVEYKDYMDCLASHNVFTEEKTAQEAVERITDEKEALHFAQGIEKDSILFYIEMRNLVPEGEREIVDSLIGEEKKHLVRLIKLEHDLR
jgi:rubrerythrin